MLGWLGAGLIGLSLGLLGSGGSILTVPILVYLLGQDEKVAITGSLAIVGGIALSGGLAAGWKRRVDWRSVVLFGLPGMAGTYAGAQLAQLVPGELQLAAFAVVMLAAATLMIRPPRLRAAAPPASGRPALKIGLDGLLVGGLTGFVGVGGGFLIVPALVLLGGLPMHLAVGTSLVIIALNSWTGFLKHLDGLGDLGQTLDVRVIVLFILIGSLASLLGHRVGARIPQQGLRRTFAVSLLGIGGLILWQSLSRLG